MFSQAEALFKESECDPREVGEATEHIFSNIFKLSSDIVFFYLLYVHFQVIVLFDQLLPANTSFRPRFKHGVPPVEVLSKSNSSCPYSLNLLT